MKFIFAISLFFITLLNATELKIASDYNVASENAKKEHKNILMFVYTQYCPWCKKMKETTFKDPATIEFINKNFIFMMADKDLGNFPQRFNQKVVPTTIVIDYKTEEQIKAIYGYKNSTKFIEALQK